MLFQGALVSLVNVTFPGNLGQVDTVSQLRGVSSSLIPTGLLYLVVNLSSFFTYSAGATGADDGSTIILPSDKTQGQAGRWILAASGFAPGARGNDGAPGPAGTVTSNSGATLGGPTTVQGTDTNIFRVLRADGVPSLNINSATPYVSPVGTRTTAAPRITAGNGSDIGFDSFITSNCNAEGDTLFRDEFQDTSKFNSVNGAHASYDAYCDFIGTGRRNHHRGFQARGRISLTGGITSFLDEWTGFFCQPILNGNGQVGQMRAMWIRDAQVDAGGETSIVSNYGIYVDLLTKGSGNTYAIYVENNDVFLGKNLQMRNNVTGQGDVFDVRQFRGLSVAVTGGYVNYAPQGGVNIAGNAGNSGYGVIRSYSSATGTPKGLAIITNNLVVGAEDPATGKQLDVAGDAGVSGSYFVGTKKVVGMQQPAIPNATDAASTMAQLNTLLAALRTHGLIAST